MKNYRILMADDEKFILDATRYVFEPLGVDVDTAQSPKEALELFSNNKDQYAVIILDYEFEGSTISGGDLCRRIKQINPNANIFIYSAVKNDRNALKNCWDAGASEFLDKGDETISNEFKEKILRACVKFREQYETFKYLKPNSEIQDKIQKYGLVGESSTLLNIVEKIEKFTNPTEIVTIYGNTGTGKELIAKALHGSSNEPFLPVNCATYTNSDNLESELFGYEKGSFTGADKTTIGILETAKNGTVFFDEIHQLDLKSQAKLLRVFQERKIRKRGGSSEYPIHCRIIVAAKANLKKLVDEGLFLEDLYYRITGLCIEVPNLADRTEDIEPLVSHFTDAFNKKEGTEKSFRLNVIEKFKNYNWPGNVRELENEVKRLLSNSDNSYVDVEDLDSKFKVNKKTESTLKELEERHREEKKHLILEALGMHKKKIDAARWLGINRSTLTSLEKQFSIFVPKREKSDEARI